MWLNNLFDKTCRGKFRLKILSCFSKEGLHPFVSAFPCSALVFFETDLTDIMKIGIAKKCNIHGFILK
jgi:hypothetical protein